MTVTLEDVTIVVPTIGRPSLAVLLNSLDTSAGPSPAEVVVVDDRGHGAPPLSVPPLVGGAPVRVLSSAGRGPAAARNRGWRAARTDWIAFLDDDVVVGSSWRDDLAVDLAGSGSDVAGVQGMVDVPLPQSRRPTDWERSTAGLSMAQWITADMAYRRAALQQCGGFDERFRRAFREDSDLALRVLRSGHRLTQGRRRTTHPVRQVDRWVSVRSQAGNADDVLMTRLHGRGWREAAGALGGRRTKHFAITAAALTAAGAALAGRRPLAVAATTAWLAGTVEFASARIAPGPRTAAEVGPMLLTSLVIPPAAVWHTLRGAAVHRGVGAWRPLPDAVLFDRDGTLVVDLPYNASPDLVTPVPGARESLDRLRAAGVPVGVVTNQSGIARGLLTRNEVDAVNARVEQLLGPFAVWQVCPHDTGDRCECRKPAPGMVREACRVLGVEPARTVLVGDIASDIGAAASAGATGLLVPNEATSPEDLAEARASAPDLVAATDLILGGSW
jgi:HAD superfamily hydrolase (TIGR01662 family)